MEKSRNQLRLERRRAESEKPGTVQFVQAQRKPRPRRWMLSAFKPEALAKVVALLGAGQRISVRRARGEAR